MGGRDPARALSRPSDGTRKGNPRAPTVVAHGVDVAEFLRGAPSEPFCYLTTAGRRTGRPYTIEIWFGVSDRTIYLLSGGMDRSDWVRNLRARPEVSVRVRDVTFPGTARIVQDPAEEATARRLLAAKYQGWQDGRPLSRWAGTALPVAIGLGEE